VNALTPYVCSRQLTAAGASLLAIRWLVTFPTSTSHGQQGSHTFVVTADTAEQALTAGRLACQAEIFRKHRRDAHVHVESATAQPIPGC
jgi:hypothetical protein